VDINHATEPACVAESLVQEFQDDLRTGVVLRFGMIVGDDATTRFYLRAARSGRPVGVGSPEGWMHLLHTDDVGPAVAAALHAPSGVYNVGAEPVRRREYVRGYAEAVGRTDGGYLGPMMRSHRVSSEFFRSRTGWIPRRTRFDVGWLERTAAAEAMSR